MQQMDQYIIWILVYLNYINFVLNFILHIYDAQKLIWIHKRCEKSSMVDFDPHLLWRSNVWPMW